MKKSEVISWIVYFGLILAVIMVGLYVIKPAFDAFNASESGVGNIVILYAVLTIFGAIVVLSTIYELIHVAAAKLSGYEVVSVNVLYFNFYKKNGKWAFRFKGYDGLTGETIINAKDAEKSSPKSFLIIPNLVVAALFILCFIGAILFPNKSLLRPLAMISATVVGLILVYNIIPFELDSKTDGYQLRLVSHKEDVAAFNELLRLRSCEVTGTDPKETKVFENITNFTAEINLLTIYNHLAKEEFDDALKIINITLKQKDKLSKMIKTRLIAQKLYIILYQNRTDDARKFYNDEVTSDERRDISNDLSMESVRAYILISSMLDESESEVQYATSRADAAHNRAEEGRKEIEKKLYKATLARVKEQHPTWVLVTKDSKEIKK
ncbi:MAG: hypothetical protein RR342_02135 [Bacilli bacterium]